MECGKESTAAHVSARLSVCQWVCAAGCDRSRVALTVQLGWDAGPHHSPLILLVQIHPHLGQPLIHLARVPQRALVHLQRRREWRERSARCAASRRPAGVRVQRRRSAQACTAAPAPTLLLATNASHCLRVSSSQLAGSNA